MFDKNPSVVLRTEARNPRPRLVKAVTDTRATVFHVPS